jgi:DNA repair exonuclease SbcCD nuclease subunit
MKLILTADWHITSKQPDNRTDDYIGNQYDKINWMLEYAKCNNVKYILHAGDFFHSDKINHFTMQKYITLFRRYSTIKIMGVYGQHDMYYHSNIDKTPLRVLESADVLNMVGDIYVVVGEYTGACEIYGCDYGGSIPTPETTRGLKILLIHRIIIQDKKIWAGQQDYTEAGKLLRQNDFDLIVSGDNHQQFTVSSRNKMLVNCGSLMRMTTAQADFKPCFWVYDTVSKVVVQQPLPITDNVFDTENIGKEKQQDEQFTAFAKGLKEDVQIQGLDYKVNLDAQLIKPEYKELKETVNEIFEEC